MKYREFGQFTLLDHMGRGRVGSVYRANDNQAGNIVAIKIFESSNDHPPDVARKLRDREVDMLISVQHPNVVKYYESGSVEGSYYYAMEFVENSLLQRMREGGAVELLDKVHILRQSANALQAIHHQGIVHRDIKPGNILLDQTPTGAINARVTDLGIAKHVSETDLVREKASRGVPGTPKYLSPEQIKLKRVDGRADIFSLGVVAYELLTGEPPFKAKTSEHYLRANRTQQPRPVHHLNPAVPELLSTVVEKMLTKEREDRYDADTLARDLELTYQHLVSGAELVEENNPESVFYVPPAPEGGPAEPSRPVPPAWRWAMVLGVVLLGAGCAYLFRPRFPERLPQHPQVDPPASGALSTAEALRRAEEYAAGEAFWQALALLRSIDPARLREEQLDTWKDLHLEVQTALAERSYLRALNSIEQGLLTRAQILLQQMKTFFPDSHYTAELEGAIQEWQRQAAE